MKRFLLGVLGFVGLLSAGNANGQSFTPQYKNIKYTVYSGTEVHANIINNTPGDIEIGWRVISHDFPTEWRDMTGVCDNSTCLTGSKLGSGNTATGFETTAPFTGTLDLKLQLAQFENVPVGSHTISIELREGNTIDTVSFEINKWPSNVAKTQKSDNNITLYPNPAHAELNILFDQNAGIKNLAVYNLIGKAVSVYRVTGSSAKLDIDSMPAGIYFIRFVDNTGRVVATRKFTHQ